MLQLRCGLKLQRISKTALLQTCATGGAWTCGSQIMRKASWPLAQRGALFHVNPGIIEPLSEVCHSSSLPQLIVKPNYLQVYEPHYNVANAAFGFHKGSNFLKYAIEALFLSFALQPRQTRFKFKYWNTCGEWGHSQGAEQSNNPQQHMGNF